jgi:small subunit ribosomal protein S8e
MNQGRKITSGKYHKQRKKKYHEWTRQERSVTLRETKRKTLRVRGGNRKSILLSTTNANILSPNDKKVSRVSIKNVLETPQNRFLARQNRILKGAIIETELGKAKITNRPSQEGQVNAILIKE